MKSLKGLTDYLKTKEPPSVFDELAQSGVQAVFHRRDGSEFVGTVFENAIYDLKVRLEESAEEPRETVVSKVEILCVYKPNDRESISKHARGNKREMEQPINPLPKNAERHHIKNKTLYPVMEERQVVFITLLDGTALRGLVVGFNRFEIRMNLKGGAPITVLRHGVLSAGTKNGRSLLKTDQEKFRDWKKSALYVEQSQQREKRRSASLQSAGKGSER